MIDLPNGSTQTATSFTCNSCTMKFVTAEFQRQHMKSDWHRYNLKRRIADLPPVTSEVFANKILAQAQQPAESNEDEYGFHVHANFRKKLNANRIGTHDMVERKSPQQNKSNKKDRLYRVASPLSTNSGASSSFSEFALDVLPDKTHLNHESDSEFSYAYSSEYTDTESLTLDEDCTSEEEHSELEEERVMLIQNCYLCDHKGHSMEDNVRHMLRWHGLYIPERSFLKDLEGLLNLVKENLRVYHKCLVCNFKGKNLESIRQHLQSKGHFRIPYFSKEDKLAIAKFYDFSYVSHNDSLSDSTSDSPIGPSNSSKQVKFASDKEKEFEGKIDNDNDLHDKTALTEHASDNMDQLFSNTTVALIDDSGVELVLPNGSKLGHRSMARYYRQNLPGALVVSESCKTVSLTDRRLAPGVSLKQAKSFDKNTNLHSQRQKNLFFRKDRNSQINYQKHFRDEILGPM